MELQKDVGEKVVICKVCGNKYASLYHTDEIKTEAGYMCASWIQKKNNVWYIVGGFGSVLHDLNIWMFKEPLTENLEGVLICDSCIAELACRGKIIKVIDNYFAKENEYKLHEMGWNTPIY